MANANARTLVFKAKDLGKSVSLMLTFSTLDAKKLYKTQFPLCWQVVTLQETGNTRASVTYTAYTAFLSPQIVDGNLVTAGNSSLCGTGQTCTIVATDGGDVITSAKAGDAGVLECINTTSTAADIGLGFSDSDGGDASPALLFRKVGVNDRVKAEFTPTLMIYATDDYQETEILRGEVESPIVWQGNLEALNKTTTFTVHIDQATQDVKLVLS